jgi:hypothetical protein
MFVPTRFVTALAFLALAAAPAQSFAQSRQHMAVTPSELKWGPAPPVLPAGAQIAVLDGDPTKEGFFSLRLKFPDGYKIAPHWHPTDENIVVIGGTFLMGLGEKRNDPSMHALTAGSFTVMPKTGRHYATAKGETIVQIYGQGPFVVNYVNPADKPTAQ